MLQINVRSLIHKSSIYSIQYFLTYITSCSCVGVHMTINHPNWTSTPHLRHFSKNRKRTRKIKYFITEEWRTFGAKKKGAIILMFNLLCWLNSFLSLLLILQLCFGTSLANNSWHNNFTCIYFYKSLSHKFGLE